MVPEQKPMTQGHRERHPVVDQDADTSWMVNDQILTQVRANQ
jgi:predicted HAD superfamily phosphohydrolase YqeG